MSHTSWSTQPQPGESPPYHLDPSPGGCPVMSPDGHWRWDGERWVLRDDPDAADTGPEASADDPEAADGGSDSLD